VTIKISLISFISAGQKNTLSFGYMLNFLYLCSAEEHHIFMSQNTRSFGRTELATHYFPNIKPMSAWLKLKALLLENPDLEPLTQLKRRTFSPAEVNKIYQALGQP
jgi:hypothetical protein